MNTATTVSLAMIAAAGILAVIRVVRPGSSLTDRVIGLDLILVIFVAGVTVLAARTGNGVFLDLLVVAGLLGFISTVAAARFVESAEDANDRG